MFIDCCVSTVLYVQTQYQILLIYDLNRFTRNLDLVISAVWVIIHNKVSKKVHAIIKYSQIILYHCWFLLLQTLYFLQFTIISTILSVILLSSLQISWQCFSIKHDFLNSNKNMCMKIKSSTWRIQTNNYTEKEKGQSFAIHEEKKWSDYPILLNFSNMMVEETGTWSKPQVCLLINFIT